MNITLRKANAIQVSINDAIKQIELDTDTKLNEFQDPEAKIQEANVAFLLGLTKKEALMKALYEIRKAVSRANATNSVDQLLAEIAYLDKVIVLYTGLAGKKEREDGRVIVGRLEKIRNTKEERYSLYGHNDVSTSVLAKDDIEAFTRRLAEFKRTKQQKQDKLLDLNVKVEIVLDPETEVTLTNAGLL